jgi:hypothetical protein
MLHPIEPAAKEMRNAPRWVQGRTYLGY